MALHQMQLSVLEVVWGGPGQPTGAQAEMALIRWLAARTPQTKRHANYPPIAHLCHFVYPRMPYVSTATSQETRVTTLKCLRAKFAAKLTVFGTHFGRAVSRTRWGSSNRLRICCSSNDWTIFTPSKRTKLPD